MKDVFRGEIVSSVWVTVLSCGYEEDSIAEKLPRASSDGFR